MSNLHKLCRLCLKKCRPQDNYEDLGHDYSIRCKVAVQEIFNIINGNSTFPTKICLDCSTKVLQFYDYFVVVQKNQEILNNGVNFIASDNIEPIQTNTRSLPSLINLNNNKSRGGHYTSIPNVNIFGPGTSGLAPMDIDNEISHLDTKPEIFSTPKPFLNFEERKAIEEKCKLIKENMSDDEKIKIFYGLHCTTCPTSTEFDKLVDYEEHCAKEHDMEVTSFVCCKTKIKREFLIDHIEYHLGTPAVRVLRPRTQTMGPTSIFSNNPESRNSTPVINGVVSVADESSKNMTTASDNDTHKYPCLRCDRTYMVKSSLKRHMTLSHGFTCDVCDKVFDDDKQLKKHQFIYHSSDGPFKCLICPNQEFETRRQLYNHKRWHTRQSTMNPIPIDDDNNDEHTNIEKPTNDDPETAIDDPKVFKCSYCSGAFHSNRNLKIHMSLKHKKKIIAAKSIKRRYCSPSFNHRPDLARLRCKICGFLSLYKQNLKRHIRIRHPEQADTEEEVNALFEDTSAKTQDNTQEIIETEDNVGQENEMMENVEKGEVNVSQIKEEQEDSLNMFHCLSNALLP